MLELLASRASAQGFVVVPAAGVLDVDELVRIAAVKADAAGEGVSRIYTAALAVGSAVASQAAGDRYERVGQMWEALGGTWGGRVSPDARQLFVWRHGAG